MTSNETPVAALAAKQTENVTYGNPVPMTEIRRRSLPMLTFEKIFSEIEPTIADHAPLTLAIVRRMVHRLDEYSYCRMQLNDDDPRWLVTALQATDHNITPWIAAQGIQEQLDTIGEMERRSRTEAIQATRLRAHLLNRIDLMQKLLAAYKSVCLYLLEGSSYLRDCLTVQERIYLQARLSTLVENANQHVKALQLIAGGEHEQFIATLLDNMKKSGFVYHPHKQFKILMTIFKICPRLINEKMGDIFDVIQGWERGNWQNEPFRGAFVEMLEMFINDTSERIDELAGLDAKDDNDSYTMMIQALAIQLLLANDGDRTDRNRNQAMLYRYLMLLPAVNRQNLADRVLTTLCGMSPRTLTYQWNETNQVTLLGHRLSADEAVWPATMRPRRYCGHLAQLIVDANGVRLEPLDNNSLCRNVLPGDLLPWHHMQVRLYDEVGTPTRNKMRDLSRLSKMWQDIEDSLFQNLTANAQQQIRKVEPEVGDHVHIIIDDTDVNNNNVLHCTIVDDEYEGEGWMHVRDIVQWFNYDMRLDYFRDRATGKPLVFLATVFARNRYGDLQFRMAQQVSDYIWNAVTYGQEYEAVIANATSNKQYTCLSREGFSFWAKAEGEFDSLKRSTFVRIRVIEAHSANAMYAEIVQVLDDLHSFAHEQPFANLMQAVGMPEEEEADEQHESVEAYDVLPRESVIELIKLLRRVASVIPDDYVGTFNYLAMTRLMAITAGDSQQAMLCDEHMQLLQLLGVYDSQEHIDTEEVERHRDAVIGSPVLQRLYNMLWLVSCIDNPLSLPQLWPMSQSGNPNESLMARMVLSLNMLGDTAVKEQRNAIKSRIKELLRAGNYDKLTAKYYGSESLHVEFKTSVIIPPDNGGTRRDVDTQTFNIMRVVCGMLNADGGTLYLGVRDNGVETGLDQDLAYFRTKDKFDLHVRNHVHDMLGATANNYVDGTWDEGTKHDVYILAIKPCPHLVTLDGKVWVRQGTSTRAIEGEDLENYKQDRQRLFAQQENVVTPTIEILTPESAEGGKSQNITVKPMEVTEHVATSQHRNNVLHDYEDGYVPDIIGYLYFKPGNKFEFSPTDIYIESECTLTLAIHEDEQSGFLAMVYEGGEIVRVAMKEILEKSPGQSYNYGDGQRLIFACPIMPEEALLLVMRDGKNNYVYRAERAEQLLQDNINSSGETMFDVDFNDILNCDIVASDCVDRYADGLDLPRKQVGYNLKRGSGTFDDAIKRLIDSATSNA